MNTCPDCGEQNPADIHTCSPQQPASETIAQTFTGVPMRKLRELLAGGWQVNGVCFTRTEEDGTVRRGAVTTGGMVLWWNSEQQPAAPGIEDLEHENRLLRARNERLQATLGRIAPRLEAACGASAMPPKIIRDLIEQEGGAA